ncbi:C-type mannose receptor 2-like [Engraulis encrasicolus]|uniref:C-type mannose receptor 2-like n=1 Tax=Engraulis encrasicolus TaxID=184585 RepID=UPI002FD13C6C
MMVKEFHVVKENKNWTAAQQYCREEFTDLATIDNKADIDEIKSVMQDAGVVKRWEAWIGLRQGRWQWSLADEGSSRENEAEFWNWANGEPQGSAETNSAQPYVLVEDKKTWAEAKRYCRENHTDLASVRNQEENSKIEDLIGGHFCPWMGLSRDALGWSDGSNSSFRNWAPGEPNSDKLVLVNESMTWMEAMQYCRQHHVDLVSVTSEKIQRWVEGWSKGASSPHVWLGLRYQCSFGFWFWVSGYSVCYDNFASDADRIPGCDIAVAAVDKKGGQWVSFQETKPLNFICTNDESAESQTSGDDITQCPFLDTRKRREV